MAAGVAPTGKPPLTWSETQHIEWRVPIPGQNTSSPIVWGGKIFFLTAIELGHTGDLTGTSSVRRQVSKATS